MASVRKAAAVTAVLRKAGVTTGLRYTQSGYVRHGQSFNGEGVMVTRNKESRYDGPVDRGHVAVFLVNTALGGGAEVSKELHFKVQAALQDADLEHSRRGDMYMVEDD